MQCTVHIYLLPFAVLKKVNCGSFLVGAKLKVMICIYVYIFFSDLRWTIPKSEKKTTKPAGTGDCPIQNIEDTAVPFLAPVNVDQLLVGHHVAVNIEEWSNRPVIGQVEKIGQPMVTIRWLDGSYNGTFRDSYVGSGANRKPWTEEIDKSQIVMIGVQFSSSRRIRREDIEELKARYSILDNEE